MQTGSRLLTHACYVGLLSLQGQVLQCRLLHAATCDYPSRGEPQLRLGGILQPFYKLGIQTGAQPDQHQGRGVTLHSPLGWAG